MLAFDAAVIGYLNRFAGRSCAFDRAMLYVQGGPLLKGVLVITVIVAMLFASDEARAPRRAHLEAVFLLAPLALFVTRALTLTLPFRLRPVHDPNIHFHFACAVKPDSLDAWSSFPSDHAVMYCMLAVGIGFVSRRLGWAAMAYVVGVILIPRVYIGYHWPLDVLVGGVLGVAFAYVVRYAAERISLGRWTMVLRERYPAAFHAGVFVWGYLLATHFNEIRRTTSAVAAIVASGGP